MSFSQKLSHFMEIKKISAYKMSKETGISDRLIGYWRKGEMSPNAENLMIIADYFNTSVDYLLDREKKDTTIQTGDNTGDNNSSININSNNLDETTMQVAEMFSNMNIKNKAKVLSFMIELSET